MNKCITSFGRGTTLIQALEEVEENGMNEITKISPSGLTWEYNTHNENKP